MKKPLENIVLAQGSSTQPCHVSHSTSLLRVLINQLKAAMQDNDNAMGQLTGAYASIAQHFFASGELADKPELSSHLDTMTVAFQEHDALNQRVEHIINTLNEIEKHLDDERLRDDPSAWEVLSQTLANSYTTHQERCIHQKGPGEEALCVSNDPDSGSIELF